MIRIGFDDDLPFEDEFDDDGNPKSTHDEIDDNQLDEESLYVYIPEKYIEKFKADYDCVVVNDFGDEYHLSEEERIAKNKFYEAFKKFSKFKHKYRKLDEFVVAMREAIKCLDFVANNNGVYSPEEFKKKFFKGKIYVNGLIFPQYKGRDKKRLNWDYVTEFIFSDEDPKNILPNDEEEIYTKEEYDELANILFDEGELEKILAPESEEELHKKDLYFDVDEDEQDGNIVVEMTEKESKKFFKNNPDILYSIKEGKRKRRSLQQLSSFVHDITYDDIEEIAKYDQIHNYKSTSDVPEFHGDLTSDKDYHKYLLELEEYEQTQIKDNYHGKMKTLEEINELQLKQLLDNNNWNIRNLYENKEKERKLRKIQKREKKKEDKIRQKLLAAQNRRKRRMGEEVSDIKSKKSKKKLKKKKNKKNKSINQYKKETKEDIDNFLLGTANRMDDFKDYKEETLDWSWDNIMNGAK